MMKCAVIGSRGFDDYNMMAFVLDNFKSNISSINSGGAMGADRLASKYAAKNNIDLEEFLPKYGIYGKRAPLIRNKRIVEHSDIVIAFWDGKSRGTKHTIDYARKNGLHVIVVYQRLSI